MLNVHEPGHRPNKLRHKNPWFLLHNPQGQRPGRINGAPPNDLLTHWYNRRAIKGWDR